MNRQISRPESPFLQLRCPACLTDNICVCLSVPRECVLVCRKGGNFPLPPDELPVAATRTHVPRQLIVNVWVFHPTLLIMGTLLETHVGVPGAPGAVNKPVELAFDLNEPSFQSDHFRCAAGRHAKPAERPWPGATTNTLPAHCWVVASRSLPGPTIHIQHSSAELVTPGGRHPGLFLARRRSATSKSNPSRATCYPPCCRMYDFKVKRVSRCASHPPTHGRRLCDLAANQICLPLAGIHKPCSLQCPRARPHDWTACPFAHPVRSLPAWYS